VVGGFLLGVFLMQKQLFKALALAGVFSVPVLAKEVRIAAADMLTLVRDSEYATQVNEVAQKQQKHMEQLTQKLNEQLDNERKKLMQAAESSAFGAQTDAKVQNEFAASRKMLETQLERDRVNASLEVEKASIDLKNKVKNLLAEYAEQHNLDAVLDVKSEGVLFVGASLDKTEDIKNFISSKFKDDKRKSSLLASVTADAKDGKAATVLASADKKVVDASKNA
jgi:Skp family chaperone for outer membrane proteins